MTREEQVKQEKEVAIPDLKKDSLVDIRSVQIDRSLPEKERVLD